MTDEQREALHRKQKLKTAGEIAAAFRAATDEIVNDLRQGYRKEFDADALEHLAARFEYELTGL